MKNNYIHHTPYLRNSIVYDHHFWYTCVKWWYLQTFFFFSVFQNFDFLGCYGGKRAKNSPNWQKKFWLSPFISQESYIIQLSFMVHMLSIFFKILIFQVVKGEKSQKTVQNDKKSQSAMLRISWTIHHMIVIYGTPV